MKKKKSKIPENILNELRWRSKCVKTSLSHVPPKPGLYAFGLERFYCGLEVRRKYVYIGQTDNLKRRLEQHKISRQAKNDLKEFLRNFHNEARCWYCPLNNVSKQQRIKLETLLIKKIKPEFNITKK